MNAYDWFRDSVIWQVSLGPAEYEGGQNLGDPQTILARVIPTTRDVAGDRVSSETIWTFPEHAVKVNDRLNGGLVLEVDAAKDKASNVLHWIVRVER